MKKVKVLKFLDLKVQKYLVTPYASLTYKIQNYQTSIMFWLFEWYLGLNDKVCSHEHFITTLHCADCCMAPTTQWASSVGTENCWVVIKVSKDFKRFVIVIQRNQGNYMKEFLILCNKKVNKENSLSSSRTSLIQKTLIRRKNSQIDI